MIFNLSFVHYFRKRIIAYRFIQASKSNIIPLFIRAVRYIVCQAVIFELKFLFSVYNKQKIFFCHRKYKVQLNNHIHSIADFIKSFYCNFAGALYTGQENTTYILRFFFKFCTFFTQRSQSFVQGYSKLIL